MEDVASKPYRSTLRILFAAIGLLLLITLVNISTLQLSRAATRMHDVAIRLALGATSGSILRFLVIESCVLALLGGIGGVTASALFFRYLSTRPSPVTSLGVLSAINANTLGFVTVILIIAVLVFGVTPAWITSNADAYSAIKEDSRGSTGSRGRNWIRRCLVIVQIACAFTLLSAAGLLLRSFANLKGLDLGF